MSQNKDTNQATVAVQNSFPATVVEVLDSNSVVINRGSLSGIKKGERFLVYGLSEKEIIDPETKESLGYLEIVRGTGVVTHVQEKMATIESDQRTKSQRVITRRPRSSPYSSFSALYGEPRGFEETETIEGEGRLLALDDPQVGDKAKRIQ